MDGTGTLLMFLLIIPYIRCLMEWEMENYCGQTIGQEEFAGEISFNSAYLPGLSTCQILVSPRQVTGVSGLVLFYFTDFQLGLNCYDTNVTIQEVNSLPFSPAETRTVLGVDDTMCGVNNTLYDLILTTRYSHLVVTFKQSDYGRSFITSTFRLKFASFHEVSPCTPECDDGTFGIGCNMTCHCSRLGGTCNTCSGICPGYCEAGYHGNTCGNVCTNMTYGVNCDETCGHCMNQEPCHIRTGNCSRGCDSLYSGPGCLKYGVDRRTSSSVVGPAVGGSAATLIVIALVVGLVVLHRKGYSITRPCTKKSNKYRDHTYENEVEKNETRHEMCQARAASTTRDEGQAAALPYDRLTTNRVTTSAMYDELNITEAGIVSDTTRGVSVAGPYETLEPRQEENASFYDELRPRDLPEIPTGQEVKNERESSCDEELERLKREVGQAKDKKRRLKLEQEKERLRAELEKTNKEVAQIMNRGHRTRILGEVLIRTEDSATKS